MSEENKNREAQEPEGAALFEREAPTQAQASPKRVSLTALICTSVAVALVAVMITFAVCFRVYRGKLAEVEGDGGRYELFELFDKLLDENALEDVDREAMMDQALKAYIAATGDRYAAYYTEEELAVLNASAEGSSEGIGINIIQDVTTVSGVEYKVLRVVNLMEGSPALDAGMQAGDMIYAVGIGQQAESISALGYDIALTRLQGKAGTRAEFMVLRPVDGGVEVLEFQILREAVTTTSVKGEAVVWEGQKIGVVKIFEFDLTTPTQFKSTMNRLIEEGCSAFVYDVRDNPGGYQISVEAVLSYFLNEGDVILSTKGKSGEEVFRVRSIRYGAQYAGCSVTQDEIGMYRSYPCTVLCNDGTASAGELFAAAFRDYQLGTLVGTTTYGKGVLQTTFSLASKGYSGAVRLTTALYYPPSGNNYHEVGIVPHQTVEPSEELKKLNLFEIDAEKDNQLAQALSLLK